MASSTADRHNPLRAWHEIFSAQFICDLLGS